RVVAGHVDDLVVDVGVVADVQDLVAGGGQVAGEHVEHDHVAQVADGGPAVDGDPAQVDPNPAPVAGHERLLAPGEGVVELQDHGGSAPGVEGGELVSYPRTGCSAARQTALAAIPSPRPQKPRPSLLLAVTRTWAGRQ